MKIRAYPNMPVLKMKRLSGVVAAAALAHGSADTVSVNPGTPLTGFPRLPPNFASFSYEVSCIPGMFTHNGQTRSSFVNLLNVLKLEGNKGQPGTQGPNIRIGGNSADTSGYIPSSTPLPANISYRISDSDFQTYAAVVPLWNGTISPGLNFRFTNPDGSANVSLAVAHLQGLTKYVSYSNPIFEAIEIGNENDLYYQNGIRSKSYTGQEYVSQWNEMVSALTDAASLPAQYTQGATWCCGADQFNDVFTQYIQDGAQKKLLRSISYHEYPLNVCNHKDDIDVYQLLGNPSSDAAPDKLTPFIGTALQNNLPFYIGEGNSIACGGQTNVSDAFAATLWAVDAMFAMAAAGVTRWNFHGCTQGAYTAIAYNTSAGAPDVPEVRPLFYGMWAMTMMAARNAIVTQQSVVTTNPLVRVWSVADVDGMTRIVVIHKDPNATSLATVTVTPANGAAFGTAQLYRMQPASGGVFAKVGISFAGQTFDGSQDGLPLGTRTPEAVPANGGTFSFTVPQASIAILEY